MSTVVLGVNNCFALKRWTEPARWLGIIREDLDLDHVQISLDVVDVDAREPHWSVVARTIRRDADALGIHVHSVFGGLISYSYNGLLHPNIADRNRRLDWFAKAIHRAADLGAHAFGGPLGALTERDHGDPRRRAYLKDVLIEELVYLAEVGRSAGLQSLLWEPTPVARELCQTTDEARDLCARVSAEAPIPLALCVDVGHQCSPEVSGHERDPYHHLATLADLTEVVHLQQTDGAYDRHWAFTAERNAQGIITREDVMGIVGRSPRDAVYLMLEILHPFEEADARVWMEMKESVAYWR